jgi:hypothetical protein
MKCSLCEKEFKDDVTDSEILKHFLFKHKKEIAETAKNIHGELNNEKKIL